MAEETIDEVIAENQGNFEEEDENKLISLDKQASQILESLNHSEKICLKEEESLENLVIPLDEESYQALCKALGSDKIEFMGIS